MNPRFALYCDEVPDPPATTLWVDLLRWAVCVMDPEDKRLTFVAGCLSFATQNEGLTAKQSSACEAILKSLHQDWQNGILVCQNTAAPNEIKEIPPMVRKH